MRDAGGGPAQHVYTAGPGLGHSAHSSSRSGDQHNLATATCRAVPLLLCFPPKPARSRCPKLALCLVVPALLAPNAATPCPGCVRQSHPGCLFYLPTRPAGPSLRSFPPSQVCRQHMPSTGTSRTAEPWLRFPLLATVTPSPGPHAQPRPWHSPFACSPSLRLHTHRLQPSEPHHLPQRNAAPATPHSAVATQGLWDWGAP